jgi:prepilin-type N-terminal cleavage/methylation domain-containing protein
MHKIEKSQKTNDRWLKRKSGVNGHPGFTVVEVLIALTILGTAAVMFLVSLSTGSKTVALMYEKNTAENLARSQLEYTKSQSFIPAPSSYSTITPIPSGFSVSTQTSQVAGRDANLQKVIVTVYHEKKIVLSLEDFKLNR